MGMPDALLARVKLKARATSTKKVMSCRSAAANDEGMVQYSHRWNICFKSTFFTQGRKVLGFAQRGAGGPERRPAQPSTRETENADETARKNFKGQPPNPPAGERHAADDAGMGGRHYEPHAA